MANSVVSSPTLPPGFSHGGGGCAGSDCGGSVVSSPTLPPGFSRGGRCCAGSDCGSSLDYSSSDEEYQSTATSRPPMQKERSHGMEENRKRSRSAEKEREAKKKKKRLFVQNQHRQQEEKDEDDDDMSNDQKSLSLSSMCVGCCESLRHHISTGCALPPCFVIVLHFLRRSCIQYQDGGIYITSK